MQTKQFNIKVNENIENIKFYLGKLSTFHMPRKYIFTTVNDFHTTFYCHFTFTYSKSFPF